jgi:hypothetical protein
MYLDNNKDDIERRDMHWKRMNMIVNETVVDKKSRHFFVELEIVEQEEIGKKKNEEMNKNNLMVNNYMDFLFESNHN